MTLDEFLIEKIREGSRDLWRGVRIRLRIRLVLLPVLLLTGFFVGLWLLGKLTVGFLLWGAAVGTGMILLPLAALLGGLGLAWADSMHALVVTGALLRSLGDVLLGSSGRFGGPRPDEQLATFASPERLARALRLRDLPLLLFLSRVVLRLDFKPLLDVAQTGLGREALVREMEHMSRRRAATLLRRLRAVVWSCVVGVVLFTLLVVRFSR